MPGFAQLLLLISFQTAIQIFSFFSAVLIFLLLFLSIKKMNKHQVNINFYFLLQHNLGKFYNSLHRWHPLHIPQLSINSSCPSTHRIIQLHKPALYIFCTFSIQPAKVFKFPFHIALHLSIFAAAVLQRRCVKRQSGYLQIFNNGFFKIISGVGIRQRESTM